MNTKVFQGLEGLGAQVGAAWAPKSRPKGVRTSKSGLGQSRRRDQDCHLEVLGPTLSQKFVFLKMYEKPKENTCFSRVREGPGAQVGATLATKSRPRGVRTAKMTSHKAAGGVRAVKVGQVGWVLLSELWVGAEIIRKSYQIGGQSLSKRPVI